MTADREYGFDCPCCGEEILVEVEILSLGHPGTMPSLWDPGTPPEGPEIDYEFPKRCTSVDSDDPEERCEYKDKDFPPELKQKFDKDACRRVIEDSAYDDEP